MGFNSHISPEKIRAYRAHPTMTVTIMDDPVMILGEREGLLETLRGRDIANLAGVQAEVKPRGFMWVNWCFAAPPGQRLGL